MAKLVVELRVVLLAMLLVMLSAKLLAALLAVSVGGGLPVLQADLIFGVQNKWGKPPKVNTHAENDATDQHEEQAGRGKCDMLALQKELGLY